MRFNPFSLLLALGENFPADSTYAGFQTQTAHNLLQNDALAARAGKGSPDLDFVRMFDIVALKRSEEDRLSAQGLEQECPHVSLLIHPRGDPEQIRSFGVGGAAVRQFESCRPCLGS